MSELWGEPPTSDAFARPGDEAYTQPPEGVTSSNEPDSEALTAQNDPPRNPDGTFAPRTTEQDAEAPSETEGQAVEEEQPLILGKYRTNEELIAAHEQLQQLTGRQGQELGELRRLVEERLPAQQPAQQQSYDHEQLSDWALNLPPTQLPVVAQQAFQQGNDQVMDAVVEAWKDVDPGGARQFERAAMTMRAAQLIQDQQAQQQAQIAPIAQTAEQFVAQHPDFGPLQPVMQQIAAEPENGYIEELLRSPNPATRLAGVKLIYNEAKGRSQTDTLSTRNTEIAREHALASEQAIKDAAVVTTTGTGTQTPKSYAEQIAEEWAANRQAVDAGWNV